MSEKLRFFSRRARLVAEEADFVNLKTEYQKTKKLQIGMCCA